MNPELFNEAPVILPAHPVLLFYSLKCKVFISVDPRSGGIADSLCSGPKVIKLFPCSTQLSTKFDRIN